MRTVLEKIEWLGNTFGYEYTLILRHQLSGNRKDIEITDEIDCLPICQETTKKIKDLEEFYENTSYKIETLSLLKYLQKIIEGDMHPCELQNIAHWIAFEILNEKYED